jgi:hypothetical protein
MLEHVAEITAIDPSATGRAADEVLSLILRLPMYFPRGITLQPSSPYLFSAGVLGSVVVRPEPVDVLASGAGVVG